MWSRLHPRLHRKVRQRLEGGRSRKIDRLNTLGWLFSLCHMDGERGVKYIYLLLVNACLDGWWTNGNVRVMPLLCFSE